MVMWWAAASSSVDAERLISYQFYRQSTAENSIGNFFPRSEVTSNKRILLKTLNVRLIEKLNLLQSSQSNISFTGGRSLPSSSFIFYFNEYEGNKSNKLHRLRVSLLYLWIVSLLLLLLSVSVVRSSLHRASAIYEEEWKLCRPLIVLKSLQWD